MRFKNFINKWKAGGNLLTINLDSLNIPIWTLTFCLIKKSESKADFKGEFVHLNPMELANLSTMTLKKSFMGNGEMEKFVERV